ncbi:probable tRNA (uracil-O(2)-)-methyltransferase [Mya arenaria]|uniref:probable tRNA (uracil-O(2)-)-methyltransferase n=1 Tax=Mya arenaria TaxID=6604 RepID=UPI0022E5A7A5|nr:probable tRNA (uracil-O(2)-)-methyltransferase [Mya arenaria]
MTTLPEAKETAEVETCSGTSEGFMGALAIWINKPHVVNRRLCGSRTDHLQSVHKPEFSPEIVADITANLGLQFNVDIAECSKANEGTSNDLVSYLEGSMMEMESNTQEIGEYHGNHINSQEENENMELDSAASDNSSRSGDLLSDVDVSAMIEGCTDDEVLIIVRQLLPKQPERHRNIPELIIIDKANCKGTFIPLKEENSCVVPEIVYNFSLGTQPSPCITLYTSTTDCSTDSERKLSLTWLRNQLLQKLARWSEQPSLRTHVTSLRLVNVAEYSRLYSELKNRYGLHFAKIWPEKTNPEKYVFEDVAIATYLLCLWNTERQRTGVDRKQSFADLGCGNGLLVHILMSEGHPGYGLDVRKRNIWDLYGPGTILKEESIKPSDDSVFPDVDWLIGNHSDELTPWIPFMAARSSYTCKYFVLPCCFWDFNSRFSFSRRLGPMREENGKYRQYLDYIREVGETCGFNVDEDTLRIPSTKRICFVGSSRAYEQANEKSVDEMRKLFLLSRQNSQENSNHNGKDSKICDPSSESSKQWINDFNPRSKVETTRNCVTISEQIKSRVVQTVFAALLACEGGLVKLGQDGHQWRLGGRLTVSDVVELFERGLLQELKSECGGLQTLLRNHSHIFQASGGNVCLRDFTLDDPFEGRYNKGRNSDKTAYHKTTLCWFHENHPDGCPKMAERCMYAHGAEELRSKPKKTKS